MAGLFAPPVIRAAINGTSGRPWAIFNQNAPPTPLPPRGKGAPAKGVPREQVAPPFHPGLEDLVVDRLCPLVDSLQAENDRIAQTLAAGGDAFAAAREVAERSEAIDHNLLQVVLFVRRHNAEFAALDLGNGGLSYYLSPDYFRTRILAEVAQRRAGGKPAGAPLDLRLLSVIWQPLVSYSQFGEPYQGLASALGLSAAGLGRDAAARFHYLLLMEQAGGESGVAAPRLEAMERLERDFVQPLGLGANDTTAAGAWIAGQLGRRELAALVDGAEPISYEGGTYVYRGLPLKSLASAACAAANEPCWVFLAREWPLGRTWEENRDRYLSKIDFLAALAARAQQRIKAGEDPAQVGTASWETMRFLCHLEPCLVPFQPEHARSGLGLRFTDAVAPDSPRNPVEISRALDRSCGAPGRLLARELFWLQADLLPQGKEWFWQGRRSGYRGLWIENRTGAGKAHL